MSSKKKDDSFELTEENIAILKDALGLTNLKEQITGLLDARDKKLVSDIMTEIAKAKTQVAPAPTAPTAPAENSQHPVAGLIGQITETIKEAVRPAPPADPNTALLGQIVGLALDNMKLQNEYMAKQIFGINRRPETSHVSG